MNNLVIKWQKTNEEIIDLEARIIELESRLKMYEQSLKNIAESDTLEFAKRTARITLG